MAGSHKGQVSISAESDIILARQSIRDVATSIGFGITDVTRIVTAVSELARNIYLYAGSGEMTWCVLNSNSQLGVEVVFTDKGPGIPNIAEAMELGYTTSRGLGLGLPGAKKLMSEFEITSEPGKGTTITTRKWISV